MGAFRARGFSCDAPSFSGVRATDPDLSLELQLIEGLPIVNHCPEVPSPDWELIDIPCPRGTICKRCREGRAGYTFRWFSVLWLDRYLYWRRDGTWLPGDPEGYRATRLGQRGFEGEILSSRGHLVVEEIGDLESSSEEMKDWITHRSSVYPGFEAELGADGSRT